MSATTRGALTTDVQMARDFLAALAESGDAHEARIPKTRKGPRRLFGAASGYFDDADAFASALGGITGDDAEGVYLTLNPVDPALMARATNRLKDGARETTGDADVLARINLLIDVDPVRPSGISATDDERDAAITVRDDVMAFLAEAMGWSPPVAIMASGNGGALVFRVNLPNEPESTTLIRRVLESLAASFNTTSVVIDTATANAARLVKVAGTVAAKGDDIPDRPWRLATATYPPDGACVSRDALARVADLVPDPRLRTIVTGTNGHHGARDWDIRDVLHQQGIGFSERPMPYGTVLTLDRCLTSTDHDDGAAVIQMASGALVYRCLHDRCAGLGWHDIRAQLGLEPSGIEASVSYPHETPTSSAPLMTAPEAKWPTLDPAALYSLPGDVVRAFDPHTEADPVATLGTLIVMFGSCVGRTPHMMVGDDRHGTNLDAVLVGDTAKARKGSSQAGPRRLFGLVDRDWESQRVQGGLSSGEGLVWAVRDPLHRVNRKGEDEIIDSGVEDKRLLCIEEEFSAVLKVATRQGNTISEQLRRAWDSRSSLRILTKNSPATATNPHISLVGHVTATELKRTLSETDQANGLANRMLWLCVRRSKALPFMARLSDQDAGELAHELRASLDHGRKTGEVHLDAQARELWANVYPALSGAKPGLVGALVARGEAITLRLALVYALCDRARSIGTDHLFAALALWQYAEDSARYLFGDATGDAVADRILAALRRTGPLSQDDIRELFSRHERAERIGQSLELLVRAGLVVMTKVETKGRPATIWTAR